MDNKQKDFSTRIIKALEELTLRVEKLERETAALRGEEYMPQCTDSEPIDLSLGAEDMVPLEYPAADVSGVVEEAEAKPEEVRLKETKAEEVKPEEAPVAAEEPMPSVGAAASEPLSAEAGLFGGAVFEEQPKPAKWHKTEVNEASAPKGKAIMDVMAEKLAWYKDMPGSEVKSLRSAIGLGDQVMFIRRLFRDDSALYQDTIEKLNAMKFLDEAVRYLNETFPEWNMESDDVYRFMMAVRRKVR